MEEKYKGVDYNKIHILKSLVYFEDADLQPMPRMLIETPWVEVKQQIIKAVKNYQFH